MNAFATSVLGEFLKIATPSGTHGIPSSGYTTVKLLSFAVSNADLSTGIIPIPNSPAAVFS